MTTATKPRKKSRHSYQTKILIDGKWRESASGKTFETINPATEEVITEVAEGDAADIDLAVKAARKAFDSGPWRKIDARDRGRLMNKLADLIESHIDELAELETLDNGKPINESRQADLPLVIDCLRYYAGWADKIHGQTIPVRGRYFCYTRREPVGVVGQIIPWNFPMLMVAWKWGPALAAGCTVVMKPAEQTPLYLPADGRAGPRGGIPGRRDQHRARLTARPPATPWSSTRASTRSRSPVRPRSAGSSCETPPARSSASPSSWAARARTSSSPTPTSTRPSSGAMLGLFLNQGQCCCAGSRLLVEDKVYDAMVERLAAATKNRKLGDPFDTATEQGPQVDKTQFDKVLGYIESGKQQGARCVTGGERFGGKGYFIKPTVFADVKDDMKIATEEIFGPVMQVLKFKDVDEVVERANTTDYGLAAAVWTRDIKKAHTIAERLRAGTVWINCYDVFDAAAPFGGFKASGIGRELGEKSLDNYTELKTVTVALE